MPRSSSTGRRRSPDRGVSHRRPTSTLRAWSGSSPRRSSLRSSPRSSRLGATRPCDSGFRVGRAINAHTPSRRPSARQPVLMTLQLRLDWRGCVTEPMLLRSDAGGRCVTATTASECQRASMVVSWVTGMTTRLPAPAPLGRGGTRHQDLRRNAATPARHAARLGGLYRIGVPVGSRLRYRRASVRVTRCADETA